MHRTKLDRTVLDQKLFNVHNILGQLCDFEAAVHGDFAHFCVSLGLAQMVFLHDELLGSVQYTFALKRTLGKTQLLPQTLLMPKARQSDFQNGADAVVLHARDHVGANALGERIAHERGVCVIGEHDNGAALITGRKHNMLQSVSCIRLGVDNDQVGLQLLNALGQKHIWGQGGHQIKTTLQQANSQRVRTLNHLLLRIQVVPLGQQVGRNNNNS